MGIHCTARELKMYLQFIEAYCSDMYTSRILVLRQNTQNLFYTLLENLTDDAII